MRGEFRHGIDGDQIGMGEGAVARYLRDDSKIDLLLQVRSEVQFT